MPVPLIPAAIAAAPGLFKMLGKFFGSPGGAQVTNLAGDLIGASMQQRGQNRAADITSQYNTQALDFLKQQDARDYEQYLKELARTWGIQDEDRRYLAEDRGYLAEDRAMTKEDRAHKYKREGEREARLQPFRQGAERGYQTLSSLLFNPNQRMVVPPPVSDAVQRRSFAELLT